MKMMLYHSCRRKEQYGITRKYDKGKYPPVEGNQVYPVYMLKKEDKNDAHGPCEKYHAA